MTSACVELVGDLQHTLVACGVPQDCIFAPVFRDQSNRQAARRGVPFCDLLAIEGHDVLVAFCRHRSVASSVQLLRGAEDWLAHFSQRLYLDEAREEPLPVAVPPEGRRHLHRIIVLEGAAEDAPVVEGVHVFTRGRLKRLPEKVAEAGSLWAYLSAR